MTEGGSSDEALRIDRWLWYARLCKSRAVAQTRAESGRIYLNGQRVAKSAARIRIGDIVTLTVGRDVVALRVVKLGTRRGPVPEARTLYEVVEDT
jgi:ribosome-associated heat shock protein Hsp15